MASDPFKYWDPLTSIWTSGTANQNWWNATGTYPSLLEMLRRQIVGRRLTLNLDKGDLALTVVEFDSRLDNPAVLMGQLNDIRLAADEISWSGVTFAHATAFLRNVQVKPASPPMLVAGPVDLTLDVPAPAAERLLRRAVPRLTGDVGADGVVRLRLSRLPRIGHLEVDATLDGATVTVRPRVLALRRTRWRLPVRMPAYRARIPELPRGLELTDVRVAPGRITLFGRLPEWQFTMPKSRMEDLVQQLNQATQSLNLGTWYRPRGD